MEHFDFSEGLKLIHTAKTAVVCGHVNPDGDCIGSTLALSAGLRALGLEVSSLLAASRPPSDMEFLVGYKELIPANTYKGSPDLFIAVDVPSVERCGAASEIYKRSRSSMLFDHHQGSGEFADCAYIDQSAAAAALIVWEFLKAAGLKPGKEIADCCYTALITDTGCFQFQNTDMAAFDAAREYVSAGTSPAEIATLLYQRRTFAALRLKALVVERARKICDGHAVVSWVRQQDFDELGAAASDGEELIDVIRQIGGIELAAMLREQGNFIRGSLRSKTDRDVSLIAQKMNGGGHRAAAGFSIKRKNVTEALELLIGYLDEEFSTKTDVRKLY